mgnify:CR=1 FL=1|tara:strand:+ start:374 stop:1045 length:672 start_codon:yes stop_codon:yes gene_type:complete
MQCRICLEGPGGHSNPLRVRCLCTTGAFHDGCLVKWLSHKYRDDLITNHDHDIIPTCEICRSPFRGVILKTKIFSIRPALYCARLVGGMHWILVMIVLHFIHIHTSDNDFNCAEKKSIVSFQICRVVSFLIEVFFRYIHLRIAYNWACICYTHQLQKFPRNWIIQVKTRRIRFNPVFLNGVKIPQEFTYYEKYKLLVKMVIQLHQHIIYRLNHMQNQVHIDNV